jgi:hypothetical protein
MTTVTRHQINPRPSLERRILDYWKENPECIELSPKLISEKFDCAQGTALNTLTEMRKRGLITSHHVVRPVRTEHEQSSCDGKVSFSSLGHARQMAGRLRVKYEARVEPYKCTHCGQIHIGNYRKDERKRRNMESEA